jgi:DNA-directed RNA polymerase specialized sigma24 family protein
MRVFTGHADVPCSTPPDRDLVAALRAEEPDAPRAFESRYRLDLSRFARRVGIPRWEIGAYVSDVLADAMMRFADASREAPANMGAYLRRALRNRYLNALRDAGARHRQYAAAARDCDGERVVTSLCSEEALRDRSVDEAGSVRTRSVLERLAVELSKGLTEQEYDLLMWISHNVPRTDIAEWLGLKKEALNKRIWRLCLRLRAEAASRAATYSPREQSEFERFRRRAHAIEGRSPIAAIVAVQTRSGTGRCR